MDGAFTEVERVDEHVLVRNRRGQFEIRVGDGALGIFPRDKGSLEVGGERGPPHTGGMGRIFHVGCSGG